MKDNDIQTTLQGTPVKTRHPRAPKADKHGEKGLSLKIVDFLNSSSLGYSFKFIDSFCDIADEKNGVYIEVKLDHFAYAQIIHGIVSSKIKKGLYLGVADDRFVKLYSWIAFEKMEEFVNEFDPRHVFSPSQVDKPELNEKAERLLGEPAKIIKLEFKTGGYTYITKNNMGEVREITDKYRIHLDLLVNWLDGVGDSPAIEINAHGWLVNNERPDIFYNEYPHERKGKQITEIEGPRRPKYIPIRESDFEYIKSLRIRHEDLPGVLHEIDRLISRKKRRERGVFWTESDIADILANELMELTKPDYVVEPCVGGGSLIKNIVPMVRGAMNDISIAHVENCKSIYSGYDWKFTTLDVVNTPTEELISAWEVPKGKTLLLYTNPPFGTAATNRLVSKKTEMDDAISRKQKIQIPSSLKKYGSGDLFIPIIGRLLEVARKHEESYIAFFSPFGLFCGRRRYEKLFSEVAKDFKFVKGYVFTGDKFHDINKTLAVAFSIWRFNPGSNNTHTSLSFEFVYRDGNKKKIEFREMPLLKEYWHYDQGREGLLKGEIVAQRCERFNTPQPKVIHLDPKMGGSEMIPENVKKKLSVDGLPDELVLGLWGLSVTLGAFGTSLSDPIFPPFMRDAYVHLPNFKKQEAIEVVAYSALHSLIKNYAEDRIGFVGTNKVFKFGGKVLTDGVEILFKLCKDCEVYDGLTIPEVVKRIKDSNYDLTKLRRGIIEQVKARLEKIGYWDYVPVPRELDLGATTLER